METVYIIKRLENSFTVVACTMKFFMVFWLKNGNEYSQIIRAASANEAAQKIEKDGGIVTSAIEFPRE